MATAGTRYAANKAMESLEWLNKHVDARPNDRATREKLYDVLDDLEKFLTRVAGGYAP